MADITLTKINTKLFELDERFGEIYPQFKTIEAEYVKKYDRILMEVYSQFSSQPLREAAAREMISMDEVYEEYTRLATEVRVIEVRLRNLQQISRNLISQNWGESNNY